MGFWMFGMVAFENIAFGEYIPAEGFAYRDIA